MKFYLTLVTIILFSFLFSAACQAANAVDETVNKDGKNKDRSSDWDTQLSMAHLFSANLHNSATDVDITDLRLKVTRDIKLNDRLIMTLGGGYGLKEIDSSLSAGLPHELHSLFVEAGATYRFNDKAFASLKLSPGFYSDFKDLGDDDLRMPTLALGGYSFNNGLSLVGGFIYRFGYRSTQFIPALGFRYQPNQYWKFDAIAPRPAITYIASRKIQFFVAGDFASDEYELKDRSLGAKAIKYVDYKAMAGVNYLPISTIKLSSSVGYAFERKFEFYDTNRTDQRMDDVPFIKVSLNVAW